MAMPLPYGSASSLERRMACPASGVLPQVESPSGEAAERGTILHRYLERVGQCGRAKALAEVREDLRPFAAGIPLGRLPVGLSAEVAYAYDPQADTARHLGRGLGRNYGKLGPTEIPVTLDVAGLYDDRMGGVYVGDYKFGRGDVSMPDVNPQVRLGALAVCRANGLKLARLEIVRFFDDPTRPVSYVDEMGEDALAAFAVRLRTYQGETDYLRDQYDKTGRAQYVREGKHCQYCPAFLACPAKTALLTAALAEGVPGPGPQSPETYQRWRDLERIGTSYAKQVKEVARRKPYDLGNGKVYGEFQAEEKEWDAQVVWDVVAAVHGPQAANVAAPRSATDASIKRAIDGCVSFEFAADVLKDTLAMIRKSGGLKTTTVTKLREGKAP